MKHIDFSKYKSIVALTGAGISVASGLRPFRGPGGIWEEVDVERYGNKGILRTEPHAVWKLFGSLRTLLQTAEPNAAHLALAKLEHNLKAHQQFLLITQNIDGLHQKAGSQNVVELHGTVRRTRCSNETCSSEPFIDSNPHERQLPLCQICQSPLRPDIVLFNEEIPPDASWHAKRALRDCNLFIAVGTSGTVSPASNYVRSADYAGARTILVNLEPMNPKNPYFKEEYLGKAEEVLPTLI
jgi:NAD-dependent deacetylase